MKTNEAIGCQRLDDPVLYRLCTSMGKVFSKMVANGKLPDSYESLVAQFDLEDDDATAETDLEEQIEGFDLFSDSPADEV